MSQHTELRPTNRHIDGSKEGAHLLKEPAGNPSREAGHPQRWKAQTRREMPMRWDVD